MARKGEKKSLVGYVLTKTDITKGLCWYEPRGRKGIWEVMCPWIFRKKDKGSIKVHITIEELK